MRTEEQFVEFCSIARSRYDLSYLIEGVGVELGIAEGLFSEHMMAHSKLEYMYGIDMYDSGRNHNIKQYRRALKRLDPFRARYSLLRMTFDEALPLFDNESLDFVFVDGYAFDGHLKGKLYRDWFPKLKPGGIMAGDDYETKYPLVMKAVNEFIDQNPRRMHFLKGKASGVHWSEVSEVCWFIVK